MSDGLDGLDPGRLLEAGIPAPTTPHGGRMGVTSPEDLSRLLPGFEVLEVIGQGGMGAVYKARQAKLGRVVALKILPLELAAEPGFVERFTREARTLATLSHPNIVAVHDAGEAGGLCWLAMEYVEGARPAAGDGSGPAEAGAGSEDRGPVV